MPLSSGVDSNDGIPLAPNFLRPITPAEHTKKHADWQEISSQRRPSFNHDVVSMESVQQQVVRPGGLPGVADIFSPEIFQIVLHNPTTSHQLLRYSRSRFCGENMEFLDKVDRYNTLLDELTKIMSDMHRSFTSPEAPRQLNLAPNMMKRMNVDIKQTTLTTLPAMELIFSDAQEAIENILASDIYPRFVKHQMTMSAEQALSFGRNKYGGLGDCFCLTNPGKADNPIVFASDGFIKVTGYSRTDIIPRNCRFLQGRYTDQSASRRIKEAVDANQESVELLLNYRKTGEPFWNLLYVAPLFNAEGKVAFFLGGQINCSTTIHSRTDILKVLSMSDEVEEPPEVDLGAQSTQNGASSRLNFFKAFRMRSNTNMNKSGEERGVGMEQDLINKIEKFNFKNQMKLFHTAYSKYLVLDAQTLSIQFFSSGVVEMLLIDPKIDTSFLGNDIFRVLNQHSGTTVLKDFKNRVKANLKMGRAVSADINLTTKRSLLTRGSERFATHWTPLKNELGATGWVVLTLASAMQEW